MPVTITQLSDLITSFRKITQARAISPENVGYLLQLIVDCIKADNISEAAYNDILNRIDSLAQSLSNLMSDITAAETAATAAQDVADAARNKADANFLDILGIRTAKPIIALEPILQRGLSTIAYTMLDGSQDTMALHPATTANGGLMTAAQVEKLNTAVSDIESVKNKVSGEGNKLDKAETMASDAFDKATEAVNGLNDLTAHEDIVLADKARIEKATQAALLFLPTLGGQEKVVPIEPVGQFAGVLTPSQYSAIQSAINTLAERPWLEDTHIYFIKAEVYALSQGTTNWPDIYYCMAEKKFFTRHDGVVSFDVPLNTTDEDGNIVPRKDCLFVCANGLAHFEGDTFKWYATRDSFDALYDRVTAIENTVRALKS